MIENSEQYYTLDEAVALATSLAPESSDVERVFMDEWMYHGVRQIGVSKEDIKDCTIDVHDLGIRKPKDYYKARDLVLNTTSGGELDYIFRGGGRRHHTDVRNIPKFIEVSETRDYFHLSSDAGLVTKATLEYYALPSTADGELLIKEIYVYALAHFIKYMLAFRNNSGKTDQLRKYWEKESARLRAKNVMPHLLEFKEGIARTHMSMITKPTRDRF